MEFFTQILPDSWIDAPGKIASGAVPIDQPISHLRLQFGDCKMLRLGAYCEIKTPALGSRVA